MALLTYDWKPTDPSGAVNAYLKGLALAQEADDAEKKRQQQMMEIVGKHILARQNEQRLADADAARLRMHEAESLRRDARDRERIGVSRSRAGGKGIEPWTPLALPGEEDTPAASVLSSGGLSTDVTPTDSLTYAANTAENLTNQPTPWNDAPIGLQGPSPFANHTIRPEVSEITGKDFTQPAEFEYMTGHPQMPGPVPDGMEGAVDFTPQSVSLVPGLPGTPPGSITTPASYDVHTPGDALTLESGAKYGGSSWTQAEEPSLFPPGMDGLALPASPESDPATSVLNAASVKRINQAGAIGGAPAARRQTALELSAQTRAANKASAYNGEPITWVTDKQAVTRGGRLLEMGEGGQLTPVTAKRVSSTYRGSDGSTYTQFSDGTWEGEKEPPQGVTIAKIGTTTPMATMEEQIAKDGYSYVRKPGYENVVSNKDGTALLTASQGANGRVTYKPFKSSGQIQQFKDGRVVRIKPDGEVEELVNTQSMPAKEQTDFTGALKAEAEAADKVALLEANKKKSGAWGITNPSGVKDADVEKANAELAGARRNVQVYVARYPSLAKMGSNPPADASQVYPNEAAARAAGHKTGDTILVVNPATGQPARARLQ